MGAPLGNKNAAGPHNRGGGQKSMMRATALRHASTEEHEKAWDEWSRAWDTERENRAKQGLPYDRHAQAHSAHAARVEAYKKLGVREK